MKILTRYLIRSHLGPFMFSFTLLTGMFFVDTLAQKLDDFAGKGLPPEVIGETLLLVFPHTIAVTLPIAVLVAVLYAYSDLAARHEIIALAASGVRPRSLLVPTLLLGVVVGTATYVFNDQVLPESNHRLKNLQYSIREKSPTFQLRERVVNRIDVQDGRGPYFLQAASIDPASSELTDVVIYDMSRNDGLRRTTYAARGTVALYDDATELRLRLEDGRVYEVGGNERGSFEQTEFGEQVHVLRGIANLFEDTGTDHRSDREMSVAQLLEATVTSRAELDSVRADSRDRTRRAVERVLGLGPDADSMSAAAPSAGMPGDDARTLALTAATNAARADNLERRTGQYHVEVHKKFVLASACIVFVLFGAPVAVRFPRGGVSVAILVATAVVAVYQVALNNGEDLADRGVVDPFWSMWTVNLAFGAAGLLMVSRMGRWIASTRSGGGQAVADAVRDRLRTLLGGERRMP